MSFAVDTSLVLVASLLVSVWLKERSLYLLFLVAYTQNFVLAYLYTAGLAGKDLCLSLILFKEFLLLELFVYSLALFFRYFPGPWPRPLVILIFFTLYCIVRFGLGAFFLHDYSADGLRKLRMICYPVQIITVSMVLSWLRPQFSKRFVRHMTYYVATLAAIGILFFLLARVDFWKQYADIASYNMDVKGEDPSTVIEEQGIPGTGAGREAFLFLSSFRAMGTFADPLAFGFAMAIPILLLTFYYQRNLLNLLMLLISGTALFSTFSRSAWIFLTLAFVYVLIQRRRYWLIFALAALGTLSLLVFPPVAEFAASDLPSLSWTNPGGEHAEGIVWFYQRAFTDMRNVLGKGMADSAQEIPENGYAFLLEHFGVLAYASFIWFCFSLFSHLKKGQGGLSPLLTIAQAIPLSILIVMHFSQYPFAFIEYLFIWYVAGMCIGFMSKRRRLSRETHELPA